MRWRCTAPNGIHPELEHDRWAQMRVLVVDACMLTPDQDAGSLRMQAILEILTSLHCKVTFVADNLEYRQPYVSQLQQRGVEVLFHPYTASIADLLSRARQRIRHRRHVAPLRRRPAPVRRAHVRAEGAGRVRHRRPAFPAHRAAGRARRQRDRPRRGAREARRGTGADPQGRRDARRVAVRAGAAGRARAGRARDGAVDDPRALARRQAVRRARGARVHRRLPASAEHRRGAVVCARDPAARARGAARAPRRTSSAARCRPTCARSRPTISSSPATSPTSRPTSPAAARRSRRCATAPASRARSTSR